jgi:hypothetical protein
MGILGYISAQKQKFRTTQTTIRQQSNVRQAKKLQRLREKRMQMEGQARMAKLEQEERARIAKAKDIKKSNSGFARFQQGAKAAVLNTRQKDNPFELGHPGWSDSTAKNADEKTASNIRKRWGV